MSSSDYVICSILAPLYCRSIIALALINFLIMLPMNILALVFGYELVETDSLRKLAYVALYTYVINCTINAIMVCILSQKHRTHFFHLLQFVFCCRCAKSRRVRPPKSSDYRLDQIRTVATRPTSADDSEKHSHSTGTWSTKYWSEDVSKIQIDKENSDVLTTVNSLGLYRPPPQHYGMQADRTHAGRATHAVRTQTTRQFRFALDQNDLNV